MRTRVVKAFDARRNFGRLLTAVGERGNTVVITKNGERLAAIVPVSMLDEWEKRRAQFFEQMRTISARVDLPEEEAMQLVNQAVQAVRADSKSKTS